MCKFQYLDPLSVKYHETLKNPTFVSGLSPCVWNFTAVDPLSTGHAPSDGSSCLSIHFCYILTARFLNVRNLVHDLVGSLIIMLSLAMTYSSV